MCLRVVDWVESLGSFRLHVYALMCLRVVEEVESLGFSVERSGELLGESWGLVWGIFGE